MKEKYLHGCFLLKLKLVPQMDLTSFCLSINEAASGSKAGNERKRRTCSGKIGEGIGEDEGGK